MRLSRGFNLGLIVMLSFAAAWGLAIGSMAGSDESHLDREDMAGATIGWAEYDTNNLDEDATTCQQPLGQILPSFAHYPIDTVMFWASLVAPFAYKYPALAPASLGALLTPFAYALATESGSATGE